MPAMGGKRTCGLVAGMGGKLTLGSPWPISIFLIVQREGVASAILLSQLGLCFGWIACRDFDTLSGIAFVRAPYNALVDRHAAPLAARWVNVCFCNVPMCQAAPVI